MDSETVSPTQADGHIKKQSRYVGLETHHISTEQINQFLAAHPITAEDPVVHGKATPGELQAVDTWQELDRIGLLTIARACDEVIAADAPLDVKREACIGKLNTVVRMQNPDLATEECIVYKKVEEIQQEFYDEQAMLYRHHDYSLDDLNRMENPAEELLRDFHEHLESAYDMTQLKVDARSLLTDYLLPEHRHDFESLVDLERVDDPTRIGAFGANVTARVVTL